MPAVEANGSRQISSDGDVPPIFEEVVLHDLVDVKTMVVQVCFELTILGSSPRALCLGKAKPTRSDKLAWATGWERTSGIQDTRK